MPVRLWIRPDVVDTALLPPPREAHLDISALVELTDRLAKADFANAQQLSLQQWLAAAAAMLKLTEQQSRLYFDLYQCVIENQPIQGSAAATATVNTYKFMVFLFAQLLSKHSGLLSPHIGGDVWPGANHQHGSHSGLSPRSIVVQTKHTEENNHLVYVKLHFKELLEIVSKSSSDGLITPEQFEHLSILFDGDEKEQKKSSLSALFSSKLFSSPKGEKLNTVLDVVRAALCQFPGSGDSDDTNIVLDGIHRKTVLRSDVGKEDSLVKIVNCHHAYVYVLAPVQFVSVFGCVNTTILIGAVSKVINVEYCENVKVITACHHLRIHNCVNSSFYLCANTRPMLLGDNRDVVFAPYNTAYPTLEEHLKRANINTQINMWDKPDTVIFTSKSDGDSHATGFTIMSPEHFSPFMVPFRMQGPTKANPFKIPEAYTQACVTMQREVFEIRNAVKEAKMDEGTKEELQRAIQVQFKEWLVNTGNIRQVQDLMHYDQHPVEK